MSSDNFDFEAWDGTIYPNLSMSMYMEMPLSKRLVEHFRARPGPPSDYTEYGTIRETWETDAKPTRTLVDDLLDEIERLRAANGQRVPEMDDDLIVRVGDALGDELTLLRWAYNSDPHFDMCVNDLARAIVRRGLDLGDGQQVAVIGQGGTTDA